MLFFNSELAELRDAHACAHTIVAFVLDDACKPVQPRCLLSAKRVLILVEL